MAILTSICGTLTVLTPFIGHMIKRNALKDIKNLGTCTVEHISHIPGHNKIELMLTTMGPIHTFKHVPEENQYSIKELNTSKVHIVPEYNGKLNDVTPVYVTMSDPIKTADDEQKLKKHVSSDINAWTTMGTLYFGLITTALTYCNL